MVGVVEDEDFFLSGTKLMVRILLNTKLIIRFILFNSSFFFLLSNYFLAYYWKLIIDLYFILIITINKYITILY